MTRAQALARCAIFSVLFLAATVAGRMTVMDGTSLSLVWPAAGVAAAWFLLQPRRALLALDVTALSAITFAVNMATGTTPELASWFLIANLAQVIAFLAVMGRLCPELSAGQSADFTEVRQLWRLLSAAAGSAAVGAALGTAGLWLVTDQWSAMSAAVWLTRNTVSIVVLVALALRLRSWLERRRQGKSTPPDLASPGGYVEMAVLVLVSTAAYLSAFHSAHGLPLAFPLLAVTVWAGYRFSATFVAWHDLCAGVLAVLFTLQGSGPFAAIPSDAARALVVQLFVGLIAAVGLCLALGQAESRWLLRRLRRSEAAAGGQAALLTTIVNSMSDGVAVVDRHGRFLLRNPASRDLLGGFSSDTGAVGSTELYGLYRPDGTPLPEEESPHLAALAGHEVRGYDVLVRNAGVPNGQMISFDCTPLPPESGGGALVVFHDVTTERQQRRELAAFAGVVAHDLLNPLATSEGWMEVASESLTDSSDPAEIDVARDAIVRVQRATSRMRNLVQDLLAHATARDGKFTPETVDLQALMQAKAVAHADIPTQRGGARPPRITVGDLTPVKADPAMLRQLLNNLLGNAIKYTPPGVAPDITITGQPEGKDWQRITIADRGIGIPKGQHRTIFGEFHRAHPDAGYSGSGLGLSICRRIVERHGGTIAAVDNPGGGTRFTFTLPSAVASPQSEEAHLGEPSSRLVTPANTSTAAS